MALDTGDFFETESPGEAARQFRLALGAFVGSGVFWITGVLVYVRVGWPQFLPQWGVVGVAVLGVVVEAGILFVVARTAVEYGGWVSDRLDWM